MFKKVLSMVLASSMIFSLAACGNKANGNKAEETKTNKAEVVETDNKKTDYKIGVVTPTLSTSEDEFRAADNMVKKYPDIVKHITLPENFSTEIETGISQIVSLASDEEMKAIVLVSGQSGLLPAIQKVKEMRPDIKVITAPIWDDPDMMAKYIDVCLDTDWERRGVTIAEKAQKMGAKTFIHYSFPTHLAKELIAKRKDSMKATCEKLGMEFVEVITPDPQAGNGPAAMQQFLKEDVPRQIEKYGKDTNIFGTNCPMYDVIIDEALKLKFIVAEQCCPTPTQAFPTVMGLEIAEEDAGNFDKINEMIREKAAEAGVTGRLSGWPVPVTVFLPEYAIELAKAVVEGEIDPKNGEELEKFSKDKFGVEVQFNKLKPELDNYQLMIMESIFY